MSGRIYHIGLDARPLTSSLSGVARVISRVLLHFPEPDRFHFHLFASRAWHPDFDEVVALKNCSWVQGSGWTSRRAGLWFNLSLPLYLRRNAIDLFWGSQQVLPPFLPRRLPTVLTYYDLVLYLFPAAMRPLARLQQRLVQSMSVSRAGRILSISDQTRQAMIKQFDYPPEQSGLCLLGYEKRAAEKKPAAVTAQLKARLGFTPRHNFIFAVSTLEPRKNYGTLIDAHYQAWQEGLKLPLVIAGRRGWESPEFFARLEGYQSRGWPCTVLENLSDAQIDALYRRAAFFCIPSLYEGFGLSLLEALCNGCPALASDIPCFHEIGGEMARYLPATSVGAWKEALLDYAGRLRTGRLRRVRFPTRVWSWERTARAHLEAFQALLG